MRGTGSHDVEIKDVFLPDAVMQGVRRPAGTVAPGDARGGAGGAAHRLRRLPGRGRSRRGPSRWSWRGARRTIRWCRRWRASWRTCSSPCRSPTRACWRWRRPMKPGPEATSAMAIRRNIFVERGHRPGGQGAGSGGGRWLLPGRGPRALLPRPAGRALSPHPGEGPDPPDRPPAAGPGPGLTLVWAGPRTLVDVGHVRGVAGGHAQAPGFAPDRQPGPAGRLAGDRSFRT